MGSKLLHKQVYTGIQLLSVSQVNEYTLSYRFLYGNVHGCVFAKNRPVSLNWTDYINEAFNSTSRYLGDLLNIANPYFEHILGQIYPTEVQ